MYTLKWPPLIKIEINHYEVQRQDKCNYAKRQQIYFYILDYIISRKRVTCSSALVAF